MIRHATPLSIAEFASCVLFASSSSESLSPCITSRNVLPLCIMLPRSPLHNTEFKSQEATRHAHHRSRASGAWQLLDQHIVFVHPDFSSGPRDYFTSIFQSSSKLPEIQTRYSILNDRADTGNFSSPTRYSTIRIPHSLCRRCPYWTLESLGLRRGPDHLTTIVHNEQIEWPRLSHPRLHHGRNV